MEQYRTFRLCGIPQGSDAERVRQLTREAFYCGQDADIKVKSLADDPLIPEEMVATLELSVVPDAALTTDDVDRPVEDITLSLDTNFFDFTPLSSPSADKWELE